MTKVGLYAIGTSTTLESNKSQWRNEGIVPGFQTVGISRKLQVHNPV